MNRIDSSLVSDQILISASFTTRFANFLFNRFFHKPIVHTCLWWIYDRERYVDWNRIYDVVKSLIRSNKVKITRVAYNRSKFCVSQRRGEILLNPVALVACICACLFLYRSVNFINNPHILKLVYVEIPVFSKCLMEIEQNHFSACIIVKRPFKIIKRER